ncbi:hypothetical protein IC582_005388 [Cucumis melo]
MYNNIRLCANAMSLLLKYVAFFVFSLYSLSSLVTQIESGMFVLVTAAAGGIGQFVVQV